MPIILMLTLQCLFPIFKNTASDYTGLSIVNPDATAREFTLTAVPPKGDSSQTARVTINSGAQRAFLLSEIFGRANAPAEGSLEVKSEGSSCTSYLTSGNELSLAGTDAVAAGSTNLIVPYVSVHTGFLELAATDTQIAIINPGGVSTRVTAELVRLDGLSSGTMTLSMQPHETVVFKISSAFSEKLPNNNVGGKEFEGYLRVISDVPVAAWERLESPISQAMLRAIVPPVETRSLVAGHFVIGGEYASTMNLINTAQQSSTVTLNAYGDRGPLGELVQITLKPGEARRVSVAELFRIVTIQVFPPPILSGFITLQPAAASQNVVGNLEIYTTGGNGKNASMLYPLSGSAANRWIIPFATTSAPYFTGYAYVATGASNVVIDIVTPDGIVTGQTNVISTGPIHWARMLPPTLSVGYLRFTSDAPIHVLGTIGTTDLNMIDHIPAIPQ